MNIHTLPSRADTPMHTDASSIDVPSSRRPTRSDMLSFLKAGRVLPGGHTLLLDVCHPSCSADGPPSCHYDA